MSTNKDNTDLVKPSTTGDVVRSISRTKDDGTAHKTAVGLLDVGGNSEIRLVSDTEPVPTEHPFARKKAVALAGQLEAFLAAISFPEAGKGAPIRAATSTALLDPLSLNLSGYTRASYSGAPWVGVASAGTSLGHDWATSGTDPTVGTAVNGLTPASAASATPALLGPNANVLITSGGTSLSGWLLVNPTSTGDLISVPGGTGDIHVRIANSTEVDVSVLYATSGVWTTLGTIAFSTWQLVQWRANATTVSVRTNGGSWSIATLTASDTFGPTANSVHLFGGATGDVLEQAFCLDYLDDATFDAIRSYVGGRYGLIV